MPQSTDLVTDLPADFEVFGQAVATSMADLLGGTTGQILSKTSATDMDFTWIANDQGDITNIGVTSPITGGGSSGSVTIGIDDATTSVKGAVQLSSSTSSTSTVLAATPSAVKSAYDLAAAAVTPTSSTVLTNKTLSDSTTLIADVADNTKAIKFDIAGTTAVTATIATAFTTAKTITLPDTTGTVALTNGVINNTLTTTTGDVIYASAANTPARLGIGSTSQVLTVTGGVPVWATPASGSTFVGCFAYMSANLNMSNGTETSMTLDLENYDTDGFHSNVTNNTRLTIPTGKSGYYLVQGQVGYDVDTTNRRITTIRKNNTSNIAQVEGNPNGQSNVYPYFPITVVAYLAAADYVELRGWQNSGGTLAALAGATASVFSIAYLGA